MYKISVIIPAYNADKFIRGCIESVQAQSFSDAEIIVVDDGSTDATAETVKELAETHENLRLVRHPENRGLFSARITGVEASTGEYIAFVDADDKITCDWLRLLYEKIKKEGADICAGSLFEDVEGEFYCYKNLDPLRQEFLLDDPINVFMRQSGSCSSWQILENKLYARGLWQDALPDLKKTDAEHPALSSGEELIFSSAIWIRAKKVCSAPSGAHYLRRKKENARASLAKNIFEKDLSDCAAAFSFMRAQLEKFGLFEKYADDFYAWKDFYAQFYYTNYSRCGKKYRLETISRLLTAEPEKILSKKKSDYFYSIDTSAAAECELEKIKEKICDSTVKAVSFDVFDTLVLRPFYYPTDLFSYLSFDFNKLAKSDSYVYFEQIRIDAEKLCRKKLQANGSGDEDITLGDIYACLAETYGLGKALADEMQALELKAEKRFCYARKTAKELYGLAKYLGKKVIAVSDMYLPEQTVKEILQNCGYEMDEVFVSSERKTGKWSGNLYKYVQKTMALPKRSFLHIGDSLESDVIQAKKAGWNAAWLPKCTDMLENNVPDLYGGDAMRGFSGTSGAVDMASAHTWLGWRCAMALAANKLFDDPFVSINKETDFNADPYRIGYFALGPYLYAVTDWLLKKAKEKGAKTVHFAARDGYIPMRATQLFAEYGREVPKTDYVYFSRKAMALADMGKGTDLRSLTGKLNIRKQSTEKLFGLFQPYLKDEFQGAGKAELCRALHCTESVFEKNFLEQEEFDACLTRLEKLIDFSKLQAYRNKLGEHFKKIFAPGDLIFDIGYSGRVEAALCGLIGYPVNSLYIHTNHDIAGHREQFFGFSADTFYHFKPAISGVVREHVFMKLAPSAIGYEEKDGEMHPVFEEYRYDFATDWMTRTMQNAALAFVRDMLGFFGDRDLPYRREDMAFPFEYYLHFSKEPDRKVFACVAFEDAFGAGENVNAFDFWQNDLNNSGLQKYQAYISGRRRNGKIWRLADKLLPLGSKRREFVKKLYHKLFG